MPKISLSVRASLGCLFASMLVVSILQGVAAYHKLSNVSAVTATLLENTIPSLNEAHAINALVLRTRLWQFRYMTAENEVAKSQSREKIIEFAGDRDTKIDGYRSLITSPEEQQAYDALKAKLETLKVDGERLRAFPAERYEDAMTFFRGPMNTNYLAVSGAARVLVDINIAASKRADAAIRSEQASALQSTVLMLCLTVLITFGAMAFCFLGVLLGGVSAFYDGLVDTAIQLAGGKALTVGHPLERLYREVRALRIAEGANDVLRLNLVRGDLDLHKGLL